MYLIHAIRQLSEARHDGDADLDGMRQELQVVTDKLSSTAAELEGWRAANGLLSTQVRGEGSPNPGCW